MSLYAVKNDEGKFQSGSVGNLWCELGDDTDVYGEKFDAREDARSFGGTVVELVEKPAPIVVSEKEAKMLERAKSEHLWATNVIQNYISMHTDDMSNGEKKQFEDRLMRAYVIGWTVEKPKRWNVKVPHVNNGYYYKDSDGLAAFTAKRGRMLQERSQFTAAEIEHYGLQECEKVEVKQHDE